MGQTVDRDEVLAKLVNIQYERNDIEFQPGKFRVRGDCVEVWPTYEETAFRVEFWGDEVEQLSVIHPTSGEVIERPEQLFIYPSKHFVLPEERIEGGRGRDQAGAEGAAGAVQGPGQAARGPAAERPHPLRHRDAPGGGLLSGHRELQPAAVRPRRPARRPTRSSASFPTTSCCSSTSRTSRVPQVRGMYFGDHNRKVTLVEHGFRLPSALDNRPLRFEEWEGRIKQVIYVSATPGPYELEKTGGKYVEQVIRPTGLLDPEIEVAPARTQVPHLLEQIRERAAAGQRVLVTTLTKRLAEDLAAYFSKQDVRCKWLHSDLDAFERVELLRDLRLGQFDVLVGVNLLREGLDLPEVSLVAILDADKEGFLRSETSLMQTIGRSARNVNAKVMLYADKVTDSMQRAIEETAPAARDAAAVQRRARHHAGDDPQEHPGGHRGRGRRPRPVLRRGRPRRGDASTSPRSISPSWKPRCSRRPRSWSSSGPPPCATASPRCASNSASRWPRPKSTTPPASSAANISSKTA